MKELALLLKILEGLNLSTPTIVGIIGVIRGGREAGKTDEDIEAESMAVALETRSITEQDMSGDP